MTKFLTIAVSLFLLCYITVSLISGTFKCFYWEPSYKWVFFGSFSIGIYLYAKLIHKDDNVRKY